ncbi:MAG: VOC family protein [Geodermatophilaceae bacterium]
MTRPPRSAGWRALGARRVSVGQGPDVSWVVLADPEGNELCVLRPLTPEELAE